MGKQWRRCWSRRKLRDGGVCWGVCDGLFANNPSPTTNHLLPRHLRAANLRLRIALVALVGGEHHVRERLLVDRGVDLWQLRQAIVAAVVDPPMSALEHQ